MSLFDDDAMGELEARGEASVAAHAHCEVAPDDVIVVRRISRAGSEAARVAVAIQESREDGTKGALSVVLTPAVARAFAAWLLNFADDADGTAPLVFHPQTPDGVDPFTR